MNTHCNRTVILGFDALDFRYLDRYQDSLPHFTRLRSRGVEAPLLSTFPPWTGSAWPSMYTGTDPSHHGVYGFIRYDGYPDVGKLVSRVDVHAPAIWNYLSSEGIPSVVLNVPVTHPAEPINGVLVPGYQATEDDPGFPVGIRDELSNILNEPYRIYSRAELSDDKDEKLEGYLELIDLRKRAAIHLLTTTEWSLAFIQVQKTDAVFHNFSDDRAFRTVYEKADELVGGVLESVDGPINVVVCSDHGIGPVRGYRIFINEVLRNRGFVESTRSDSRISFASEKSDLVNPTSKESTDASTKADILLTVADTLDRFGATPDRIYTIAEHLGVSSKLRDFALGGVTREVFSKGVDWRSSIAYCRDRTRLGIRINLEGREPSGIVPSKEYEHVRSDLIELLSELTTPDGRQAFDFVVRCEEIYDGQMLDDAPDILMCPREMDNVVSPTLYGREFLPEDKYDHKRKGVFIAAGPAFNDDVESVEYSLTDVAPTVMASIGLPIPSKMTGRVPDGLLSTPSSTEPYHDVTYGTIELDADRSTDEVTERLEDLGYL